MFSWTHLSEFVKFYFHEIGKSHVFLRIGGLGSVATAASKDLVIWLL